MKLIDASQEWGCFRIINHQIPTTLMSDMKSVVRSLLDLPPEIKRRNTDVIAGSRYVAPNMVNPLYEGLGLYDIGSTHAVLDFCTQLDASPQQRCFIEWSWISMYPSLNGVGSVSIIWRDILAMVHANPRLHNFFVENVERKIGDGNRVKFWDDIWRGSLSLKSQFPRLYQLSVDKEITVKLQITCRDSTNNWCFNFRRPLLGWEADEVIRLQNMLGSRPCLHSGQKDSISWKAHQSGLFKVGDTYDWDTILRYSQSIHELAMDIGNKLAQSMGLASDLFMGWPCQFRINKYSFTPETLRSSRVQIHTDSGFLTILQDDENVSGLEVMDKKSGEFVPVDPMPGGTLLVNLGDFATVDGVGAASSITLSLNYPYSSTHPKPTSSLRSLSFSSTTSHNVFSTGLISMSPVVKPTRHSIICEAAPNKKADSAAKRARQAEKRRVYNKARKSEVNTRMKKFPPSGIMQPGGHYLQQHQQAQQMTPQSLMAARSSMLYSQQQFSALQQQQALHSQLGMSSGGSSGLHMLQSEANSSGTTGGALGAGGFPDFGRGSTGEGLQASGRGKQEIGSSEGRGGGSSGGHGGEGGESLYLKASEDGN
ncbi:unnamed protein product [Camellia sinensis]